MREDPPTRCYLYPLCLSHHPHARGSTCIKRSRTGDVASTRIARGSTPKRCIACLGHCVYPACAGIHRLFCSDDREKSPHARGSTCLMAIDGQHNTTWSTPMRGDPPSTSSQSIARSSVKPHAKRSTISFLVVFPSRHVYPACAEIHLAHEIYDNWGGLPACAGIHYSATVGPSAIHVYHACARIPASIQTQDSG